MLQPAHDLTIDGHLHFGSTIRDILLANQITPQVLDDFEPSHYIQPKYPDNHETVLLGNDIPVESVQHRPTFTFHSLDVSEHQQGVHGNGSSFTLILTDPDALSREHPVRSEMCHWIITNLTTPLDILGTEWPLPLDLSMVGEEQVQEHYLDEPINKKLSKSKPGEVESYFPPSPPKKTGPHRHVFILLQGDTPDLKPPKERPHWGYGKERHGVRDWAAENNLAVAGVNFFFAQHKKQ